MKKYIFWLGVCIIIPIIIQMILADNMSFKWVACRRYLIIASLISNGEFFCYVFYYGYISGFCV